MQVVLLVSPLDKARMVRLLTIVALGGMLSPSCQSSTSPSSSRGDRKADVDAAVTTPPPLDSDIRPGVCLAHNWQDGGVDGYGTETSRETLRHLDTLGVDAISLTPFGSMSSLHATTIRGEHNETLPDGGEHREAIEGMIEQAREFEMHVVLKPHIWVRGGAWRGDIEPTDADGNAAWDQWWASYRDWILHYARLAERHDVETLVAGVELNSAVEARPESMRDVVDGIRSVYEGRVTYAANWNESLSDELWTSLDSVGVQFYPPLAEGDDPSIVELRASIREHLTEWARRAQRLDRPLELLEVGYKSSATAVSQPWGWPEDLSASERVVDEALQANAYRALFLELVRLDSLHSIYIWKYFTDPTRNEGGAVGFSPRDKRAESVLRRAYGGASDRGN